MQLERFLLAATRQDVMRWIMRTWQVSAPPGAGQVVFHPVGKIDGDAGPRRFSARGMLWETSYRELFKLSLTDGPGTCEVEIECCEPRLEPWLCRMVDSLAPNRAAGTVQPMAAIPPPPAANAGAATPSTLALGLQLRPSAPQTPAPPPAEKNAPSAPKRPADRRRWMAIWRKIRLLVAEGASNDEVEAWFAIHDDRLRPSKDVLIHIIRAGEAGLLDPQGLPDQQLR